MDIRKWGILLAIFIIALLPRMLNLDAFISPDEPRWRENTLGFREGLKTGDFSALYQQPHPGITTMWLASPVITSESWAIIRTPQAIFISVLVTLAAYLMMRLWGTWVGVVGGLLLALDAHFIAHSRVLAMDALLSIFIILALLFLMLWQKEKKNSWIIWCGVCCALAVLSKMIGVVILQFVLFFLLWQKNWRALRCWIAAGVITSVVVFPTIVTDFGKVAAGTREFFATEHYSQRVHALGPWWYPQAFLLWTTPLQILGLIFAFKRKESWPLMAFAVLFFLAIQYSLKKGDRYMLPDFLLFDILAALGLTTLHLRGVKKVAVILALMAAGWQVWNIFELHPHYLAYRNPFFRSVAESRTMGWGEGLDLAAEYLNQKPVVEGMLVAAYYEGQFGYKFKGEVTGVERLAKESLEEVGADYVVLYRAMQGRAPERWETKVLEQFFDKAPEKVITLNGEEYVWIYKAK